MFCKLMAIAIVLLVPAGAYANPKFAKETNKACATCHVKAGKPELNDVGKCFKANKFKLSDCEKKAPEKKK